MITRLHKKGRDIDLEVLVASARKVFTFLSASNDGMSDALAYKLNAERDARDNYYRLARNVSSDAFCRSAQNA